MASVSTDFNSILDLLEKQEYSSKLVENLINDLLDLAKIENNKFKLYEEYFNLPQTITETFQIMLFWANSKNIELSAQIDSKDNLNIIKNVFGDEGRIK